MSSYLVRLTKRTEDGNIRDLNGKNCTLRVSPFSTDTYSLSALPSEDGFYYTSVTSSDDYKLFVNGVEETSYGGDEGFYIATRNVNGWSFDRINSVRLSASSNNVVIGTNIADSHKLAVLGDVSVTGNIYANNLVLTSDLSSLSGTVGNLNRFTLTSNFISTTGNIQSQVSTLSSNQTSLSSNVGNLNRFTLTSTFASATASLTGATILSKTANQIYATNSSDSLRLGNSSNTGMKLDVQGQVNIGNTTYYGTSGEKGRISWGGVPQNFNLYALNTLNASIGTQAGEIITVASGGNVGINTTTPNSQLAVNGNTTITGNLTAVGDSQTIVMQQKVAGSVFSGFEFQDYTGITDASIKSNQATGEFRIFIKSGGYFPTFYSNGNEAMRLTTGGNLAIGTTVASQTLSVLGNASITGGLSAVGNSRINGNQTVTGNLICSTALDIGLFVLSTGKVGINTSTPTVAFEVSGSLISGQSFSLGKGSPSAALGYAFNRNFTNGAIFDSSRYAFQFTRPSNADRLDTEVYNGSGTLITARAFTVDGTAGFIGIGTNSPATRLHVVGHQSLSGGLIRTQLPDNSVTSNLVSSQAVTYQKGANYIIAYNDSGTMKYRYLVLSGTDASWIYSTTAP